MSRKQRSKQNAEIEELRIALRVLVEHNPGSEEYYSDPEEEPNSQNPEGSPTRSKPGSIELTRCDSSTSTNNSVQDCQPIWDNTDGVYRCVYCAFEVYQGHCQSVLCNALYDVEDLISDYDYNTDLRVVATDDTSLRSSRRGTPRGTTPTYDVDVDEAYSTLVARGATLDMYKRFSMEFTAAAGIIAWLDQDFIEEFAGPRMANCQRWKLYLGRSLCLDWDDDDGSVFITEFLEEAVIYPCEPDDSNSSKGPIFETYYSIYEDIWITQPRSPAFLKEATYDDEPIEDLGAKCENSGQDEEQSALLMFRNEYEDTSGSETDEDRSEYFGESELDPPENKSFPHEVIYADSFDGSYEPPSESTEEETTTDSFIDSDEL